LSADGSRLPKEIAAAVDNAVGKLQSLLNIPRLEVRVTNGVDPHTGLGSKTAILLALGRAASILSGRRLSGASIAQLLGRGGTSGIGVHCFSRGGLVWDAGHVFSEKGCFAPSSSSLAQPPKAILRLPVRWLSVVHFRFALSGLHGEDERSAFSTWCPTSNASTVGGLVSVSSLIVPGLLERRENLLQLGLKTGWHRECRRRCVCRVLVLRCTSLQRIPGG
jgi:beta-ribofuranosylaminobenzene 5'-phosphate synthase